MTQRKIIPKEIKNEILGKVRGGEKVVDLAKQYAVSDKSIYTWLRQETGDQVISPVQYNRIKRENEELKITYENQLWCSDTSRFIFHGNKYIVTVIDIFTRQVLGVAIGRHHSDQGEEFIAEACTNKLEARGTKIQVWQ